MNNLIIMRIQKLSLVLIYCFISAISAFAKEPETDPTDDRKYAKIEGTITDAGSTEHKALPLVTIEIKGTSISETSDENGKYSIAIKPGKYSVVFRLQNYETKVEEIKVDEIETKTLNVALVESLDKLNNLADVVIKTKINREKETSLLLEQKNVVSIKQNIGVQELSRKGVSDVATAVTKTTGITRQEGSGNIFVRGLGDRYNSTTMNSLPIPSDNPEKKNIDLEIFSTDILEYISIDKVYNSTLYGDFAGGNVNINSRNFKGKKYIKVEAGIKLNSNAIAESNFQLQKGPGALGLTKIDIPQNPLTQYNFATLQLEKKTPVGLAAGVSGGKSFKVGDHSKLNLFANTSFGSKYSSITDGTAKGGINKDGVVNKDFDKFMLQSYDTNLTGMANVGYKINNNNTITYNTNIINSSSQSKEEYYGMIKDVADNGEGYIRRNSYSKNLLYINQLLGEHLFGDISKLEWGVSYNLTDSDMPDRTQNTFRKIDNYYVLSNKQAAENNRYFQYLEEKETAVNLAYALNFNKNASDEYLGKITFGYNGRFKNRNFEATQFNLKPNVIEAVDPSNMDLFYNQENFAAGKFEIKTFRGSAEVPNAQKPQTYTGDQQINAGFVNVEHTFNKLTGVVGFRAEDITQNVSWNTQLDTKGGKDELTKLALLPSLTLKYALNQKQNLRLGLSKTYTLPQFKERALFLYEDITQIKTGNPDLYASDDYNADIKWEIFPTDAEIFAVTAYGKYIQNPINETTIASSTNDISFVNTGNYGYVTGAEFEAKKTLYSIANNKKITGGFNASYLYTNQELSAEKVKKETKYQVDFTNENSKFTGASDLLLNADISYYNERNKDNNLYLTCTYNYYSDRVYALGTNGNGNLIDKAFGTLDFIAKAKLKKKIGVELVTKNLLNPMIERVQNNNSGDISVLTYKKGINIGINLNYQF